MKLMVIPVGRSLVFSGSQAKKFSNSPQESDSIFMPMISGPCQTAGKDANASKEDPGLRAGDCLLKIFRQASAAIELSKCSFDHPALWLRFKCTGTLRSC